MTTIQLCLLRLFHIASVRGSWEACFVAAHVDESEGRPSSRFRCKAVIHWYGPQQNMRCSRSTDAYDVKQVLKTFKSAFMLLLIQKEQHKHSSTTHHYCIQLQFDWDSLECTIEKLFFWKLLKSYPFLQINSSYVIRVCMCAWQIVEIYHLFFTIYLLLLVQILLKLLNCLIECSILSGHFLCVLAVCDVIVIIFSAGVAALAYVRSPSPLSLIARFFWS